MNISYIILKHVIWRLQIYNLFREIFKFREDKSNNVFRKILKCFRKTAKFEFMSFENYWGGGGGHPAPLHPFILQNCVYSFEAPNLEISNMLLLSRNISISRFCEHFKKFREICFTRIFAKFKYLAKQFILMESSGHML